MKFSKENIGSYLYTRLPSYHRQLDEQNNLLLKRFMEVLDEGFKVTSNQLDEALKRVQASKCPEDKLENLARSLGADWISTIHPKYQRQIVAMLVKLYKQKGTIDAIRFIASELSGFEAKIIEGEIPDEYFIEGDEKKRLLTVKLQAPEMDDPVQAQQHESTISEVISNFVPVHTKFVLVVTYFYDEHFYKRFKEVDTTSIVQSLGTDTLEISPTGDVESSKIMLNYIHDEVPIKDLGINNYVMCTTRTSCRLTSVEGRLTTPTFVDKIIKNGEVSYTYE